MKIGTDASFDKDSVCLLIFVGGSVVFQDSEGPVFSERYWVWGGG